MEEKNNLTNLQQFPSSDDSLVCGPKGCSISEHRKEEQAK